jgi:hypothetical protein
VTLSAHYAASRLRRLADTLAVLKQRVREAVASETGRAVGEAVRDLLSAALAGRPAVPPYRTRTEDWDEDPDTWRNDDGVRYVPSSTTSRTDDREPDVPRRTRRWSAAVAFGATAARCWAARSVPGWVVVALGLMAGAATWFGGTVAQAALALLGSVTDLFPESAPARFGLDLT